MKKLLIAAFAAAAVLSAQADKYYVYSYSALTEGETQIPCNYYEWEGTYTSAAEADATAPGGGAHVRTLTDKGWFGGGWESIGDQFDFSTIAQGDYDLVFSMKTDLPESAGELWIQFNNTSKGVQLQPNLRSMMILDNAWHTYRLNLREYFASVLDATEAGDNVYCFTFGGTSVAGCKVALADIYFEPKQEMPAISASAGNITMTTAEISYEVTLPASLEGANVEVLMDGEATTASPVQLSGLTPGTAYTHTLVARATLGGKTVESAPAAVSFSTLRDPSLTPVWTGRVKKELSSSVVTTPVPVVYSYELIANADNTLTVNVTIEGFQDVTGAVPPQFNCGNGFQSMTNTGDNTFTYTTEQTFTEGQSFNELFFYLPFAGAADRTDIEGYTYGASNDPGTQTGIEAIESAAAADVRYFDLRGAEVPAGTTIAPGIYIRRSGDKAVKVIVR